MDELIQDIKTILPQSRTLTIGGESITLRPFLFNQLPQILPKLGVLLALVEDGQAAVLMAGPELLADIHDLFALATGKPKEWIEQLDAQAGIELTAALAELNEGFFRAVLESLPKLTAVMDRLGRLVPTGASSRPT